MSRQPYDRSFYAEQAEGSQRSAIEVVPFIVDIAAPRSVVDVGCGLGTWLSAYRSCGVEDCSGLDGAWIEAEQLRVPRECFRTVDLLALPRLTRRFDLAQCLEVVEHLPPSAAGRIVEFLTGLADVVVFSAASPHQGGRQHVNEQWPEYWRALFAQQGYAMFDVFRPKFWVNARVDWWYAQNMFLYVNRNKCPTLRICAELGEGWKYPERVIHPHRIDPAFSVMPGLRDFFRLAPQQLLSACKESVARRARKTQRLASVEVLGIHKPRTDDTGDHSVA